MGETCRALLFFGSQSIIKLGECIERNLQEWKNLRPSACKHPNRQLCIVRSAEEGEKWCCGSFCDASVSSGYFELYVWQKQFRQTAWKFFLSPWKLYVQPGKPDLWKDCQNVHDFLQVLYVS